MKELKYYSANYQVFLPKDKSAQILDFGCGPGAMLAYLQQQGYLNLYGADIVSHSNWESLRENKVNLFEITDTRAYLKTISGKYDLIVVKDVIYYFKEDEVIEIVELLKKALRPGGKILFEIHNACILTGPFVKYKDFGFQLLLTEHSIGAIIKRAGMKVDHICGNKTSITGVTSFLFFILNKIHVLRLRLIYFSERSIDSQNPKIFSKKIIAIASAI